MNKYFSLYEECLLVPEEKNPAIYNTFSGEIYIITQEEAKFLSYLEMGEPFDKASDFAGILPEVAKHYLELYECKLRSNGMFVPPKRNGHSILIGTKYRCS